MIGVKNIFLYIFKKLDTC